MRTIATALSGILMVLLVGSRPALSRDLRFATIDVAPWASADDDGRMVGFFPDVVRELERRTGHSITMTLHPFARIDHDLESGDEDCSIILWNDYRSRFAERGELVSTHVYGAIARRGITLKAYDDLHHLTVSVLRGVSIEPRFDNDAAIKKEFDVDYLTGIRKVAHNHVDAVMGALATIRYQARAAELDGYLGEPLILGEVPLTLQCSKKSPNIDVMPDLNQAIRDMRGDGTLQRIKAADQFL